MKKKSNKEPEMVISSTVLEVLDIVGSIIESGKTATVNHMKNELNMKSAAKTSEFLKEIEETSGCIEFIQGSKSYHLTETGRALYNDEQEVEVELSDWSRERYFGRDGLIPRKKTPEDLKPLNPKFKNGYWVTETKFCDFVFSNDLSFLEVFPKEADLTEAAETLDEVLLADFSGDDPSFTIGKESLRVDNPVDNIFIGDIKRFFGEALWTTNTNY